MVEYNLNLVVTLSLCFFSLAFGISDTITANQSLSGDQTIISSGGTFELGFYSPGKLHDVSLELRISDRAFEHVCMKIWRTKKKCHQLKMEWVAVRNDFRCAELELFENVHLIQAVEGKLQNVQSRFSSLVSEHSTLHKAYQLTKSNLLTVKDENAALRERVRWLEAVSCTDGTCSEHGSDGYCFSPYQRRKYSS